MKLTTKLFGITAIIAVIVFLTMLLTGCQDDDGDANGTWIYASAGVEVKFNNGNSGRHQDEEQSMPELLSRMGWYI